MQLLNFRGEVSYFKKTQLEGLLEELCVGLPLPVIADFLDSCSANFRTLEEKWVGLLGVMLTGHAPQPQHSLKGKCH